MTDDRYPMVGEVLTDTRISGRTLTVTEVRPRDPLGREIVGRVALGDQEWDYATDLPTCQSIWRRA